MDWYCMTVSSRDSPRTSKENIAALEKKYGKNSNVVRVRVDGLPPGLRTVMCSYPATLRKRPP